MSITSSSMVEQAVAALRAVTAPPQAARATRDAADQIEQAWQRSPFVAGLGGDLSARTELINFLSGERVLDPAARVLGCASLRVRRGAVLRYRTLRGDGSMDDKRIGSAEERNDFALGERADEVRGEAAIHEGALVTHEKNLPLLVRHKPPVWAFWVWPLYALLALIYRSRLKAWRDTQDRLTAVQRRLAGIEGFAVQREEQDRASREQYFAGLRIVSSGGPAAHGVREVQLELASGPLPEHVELVELSGELRASADVDAVLVVERDGFYAPTPDGMPVSIGPPAEVIPALIQVLARARALTLARRARDRLAAVRDELEVEIARVESTFSGRIERIQMLALESDRQQFAQEQLDRVRPSIGASVNAVLEHASTHMGSELAQLGSGWIAAIANANNNDELKAAIARIEEEWPGHARRIAQEVNVLVIGGAGGVGRDLYTDVVAPLRAHGLPEEHLRAPKLAPEVPPVDIMPSLANPTTFTLGSNWLAGLFKSFTTQKTDVREKVHARIEHIREVAAAEILDVEPQLHASIRQALSGQLERAIDVQMAWHATALEGEHAAIADERAKIAPLVRVRDAIAQTDVQLAQATAALEAEQPGVAAAAVAAAS